MKIKKAMLIFLLPCIIIAGCSGKNVSLSKSQYNDVKVIDITVDFNNLVSDDKEYSLSFVVQNNANEDITYGKMWYLEVQKDGIWYSIDYKQQEKGVTLIWDLPASLIKAGEQVDITVPLYGYYETPLAKGIYRIVQPVGNGYILSLEFSV